MSNQTPPIAPVRPHEITTHGHTRIDDYYWLREKRNPEVIAYLEAENAYTEAVMAHTGPLQEQLYQEMVGRIQETDLTVPVRKDDYYYYSRTVEGLQYDIHCRRRGGLETPEEALLDLNELAADRDFLRLGLYKVSPDHRILAYSLDEDGAEDFVLYFKDLSTGERLPDQIHRVSFSAEWANDSQTFFYTLQDQAKRSDRLLRHRLGSDPAADRLVYHEPDELYRVHVSKTKDDAYLILGVQGLETTESHYLEASQPEGAFKLLQPRRQGIRYSLNHREGLFYIVTSENAPNYKVMTAPAADPVKDKWQEMIPHRDDAFIDNVELFARHMVVYGRRDGLRTIDITNLAGNETHAIEFPEPVYTYARADNPEYDTGLLRFTYMSLTTPDSVYDYHMDTHEWALQKRKPVLGGYEPADYQSERIFATAEDGARIPISLVYKKGMERNGNNPCLLFGYGSYGFSIDPSFQSNRLSLLDRGFIFGIAHIRGGQEMGRAWYEQGKFLHKKNTFTDFIACAHHLVAEGYTRSEQLVIMGGSAGGLLIGAVLNLAPDLFKAAVAKVPFVDVVTTMLDASIPLTVPEYDEWGNPNDEAYYHYMLSYSPYDTIEARTYPHLLITAGLNDPRVQYWEPAKWAAKLRRLKIDDNRLLLKTNMGAGHAGASGRYDYLKEVAFEFAFLLDALGR